MVGLAAAGPDLPRGQARRCDRQHPRGPPPPCARPGQGPGGCFGGQWSTGGGGDQGPWRHAGLTRQVGGWRRCREALVRPPGAGAADRENGRSQHVITIMIHHRHNINHHHHYHYHHHPSPPSSSSSSLSLLISIIIIIVVVVVVVVIMIIINRHLDMLRGRVLRLESYVCHDISEGSISWPPKTINIL